jgi:putative tryptophan/tyrosine transport system substrate-binding protein
MKRREFIAVLGGAAAWPLAAYGQQARKILRVGTASPFPKTFPLWHAFRQRLRELGHEEGQNFVFEFLELADQFTQQEAVADAMNELVRRKVDILVDAGEEVSLKAALAATNTLPIVILAVTYDPVLRGYVSSIARSTGNVTGLYLRRPELVEKQIAILAAALPGRNRLAVVWDSYSAEQLSVVREVAPSLRLELQPVKLEATPYDFEAAFRVIPPGEMLLVLSSSLFALHRSRIAELAIRSRLATMFTSKTYVHAGGLLSYGPDIAEMFRRAAEYVDRIAKGARPTDLPIEQPTRFELVLNLRTATALGISIPPTLVALADEVIE